METAWQAEELLRYIAGEEAAARDPGAGAADDRRACRKAWEAWWKEHGPKVDFAKLDGDEPPAGADAVVRRRLAGGGDGPRLAARLRRRAALGTAKLSYPADARLMAGGRVLVAERSLEPRVQIPLALPARKKSPEEGVSMRDLQGKVLWRYRGVDEPTQCQAMPDGRMLIAGRELQIAEVD